MKIEIAYPSGDRLLLGNENLAKVVNLINTLIGNPTPKKAIKGGWKKHAWSKEEDALILQATQNHNGSKTKMFRSLGRDLGLTRPAVSSRYYKLTRNK